MSEDHRLIEERITKLEEKVDTNSGSVVRLTVVIEGFTQSLDKVADRLDDIHIDLKKNYVSRAEMKYIQEDIDRNEEAIKELIDGKRWFYRAVAGTMIASIGSIIFNLVIK